MNSLNVEQIQEIIPHRHPFLLIDKIEDYVPGEYAIGYKGVSYHEDFFRGHFPQKAVMPGVLILEALAQTGAVAILSVPENQGKIAFFGGVQKCRFKGMVFPGDQLKLETKIIKRKGPVGVGEAVATVNGKVVVTAELTFMVENKKSGAEEMIEKILIANRGEIAVRVIRACREMGIRTVAVYSEADKDALHTQLADEAVCIGPAPSAESYLNMQNIISATLVSGADAIHPGFGFLSENSKFAELCEQCKITYIGPDSKVISALGNKSVARNTMVEAGVPVIPGSKEPVYTVEEGEKIAGEIGYQSSLRQHLAVGEKECVSHRHRTSPDKFPDSTERSADGIRRRNNVSGTFCRTSASYRISDSCR